MPAVYLSKQNAALRLDISTKTIDRLRAAAELDWIHVGSLDLLWHGRLPDRT